MKILKPGILPIPVAAWPVGCSFECFYCHAVFLVEAGDDFTAGAEKRIDGARWATMRCPSCAVPQSFPGPRPGRLG